MGHVSFVKIADIHSHQVNDKKISTRYGEMISKGPSMEGPFDIRKFLCVSVIFEIHSFCEFAQIRTGDLYDVNVAL